MALEGTEAGLVGLAEVTAEVEDLVAVLTPKLAVRPSSKPQHCCCH